MVTSDVRVHHDVSRQVRIDRAAKAAVKFIRRQAEMAKPENKDELVRRMWLIYFRASRAHMLAAPRATKRVLKAKYGPWTQVGVQAA